MGIMQEKRTVATLQPEKKEERTLDSIRFNKDDIPVENEKQEEVPEKAEEPDMLHAENAEAPAVEKPAATKNTQPKKAGRPKKVANKKK